MGDKTSIHNNLVQLADSLVGVMFPYAGDTAPDGFLLCNGATYDSIAEPKYAPLYERIGIKFGGTGPSDFKVPDTRGYFLRGRDDGGGVDPDGARAVGSVQNDKFQGHYHRAYSKTKYPWATGGGDPRAEHSSDSSIHMYFEDNPTYVTVPTSDGTNGTPRTGSETRPVNLAVNYIIKY